MICDFLILCHIRARNKNNLWTQNTLLHKMWFEIFVILCITLQFHAMMLSSDSRMFLSSSNACQQLVSLTYQLRQCISCHALLCFRPATLALAILSLELEYMGISWLPTVMGFQRLASVILMHLLLNIKFLYRCTILY